jgi:ubiquinone/menaquinone biosynthesis C-methylase UbiE
VLAGVQLADNSTLLDVGCGDGLIGLRALQQYPSCRVIFSDISQVLLDHVRALAAERGVRDRCDFVRASVTDLSAVVEGTVDAVTIRSVLIYVADKQQALGECYRVLKPGGRLSLFEPINRFGEPQPAHMFWGHDVSPIVEIALKVKVVYQRLQPLDTDPMMNFDERDLLETVERAGFASIRLDLQTEMKSFKEEFGNTLTWDTFIHTANNPKIPTLAEAMGEALTADEMVTFAAHMKPLVDSGTGVLRTAVAYISATKSGVSDGDQRETT